MKIEERLYLNKFYFWSNYCRFFLCIPI